MLGSPDTKAVVDRAGAAPCQTHHTQAYKPRIPNFQNFKALRISNLLLCHQRMINKDCLKQVSHIFSTDKVLLFVC